VAPIRLRQCDIVGVHKMARTKGPMPDRLEGTMGVEFLEGGVSYPHIAMESGGAL